MKKSFLTLSLALVCATTGAFAQSSPAKMSPKVQAKKNLGKLVEYKDLTKVMPTKKNLVTSPRVIERVKKAMKEGSNALFFQNIVEPKEAMSSTPSQFGVVGEALVDENSCSANFGIEALDVTHHPSQSEWEAGYDELNSVDLFVDVDYATDFGYEDARVQVNVYAEHISTGSLYLIGESDTIVRSSVYGESAVTFAYNISSTYANNYYLYSEVIVSDLYGTACALSSDDVVVNF